MPRYAKLEETTKALDRIFADVDPQMFAVGALGGIAAAGGIVPPLTRLLTMFGSFNGTGDGGNSFMKDFEKGISAFGSLMGNPLAIYDMFFKSQSPDPNISSDQKAALAFQAALFASGAMEAILMYKMMENPDLLATIIKAPTEALKAIGDIVPG